MEGHHGVDHGDHVDHVEHGDHVDHIDHRDDVYHGVDKSGTGGQGEGEDILYYLGPIPKYPGLSWPEASAECTKRCLAKNKAKPAGDSRWMLAGGCRAVCYPIEVKDGVLINPHRGLDQGGSGGPGENDGHTSWNDVLNVLNQKPPK